MVASAADLPSLYYVEWHYIDFVLSCLGNVSQAARVLGIRRSTLQRKRKKTPPLR
jgi:ActR/RegA family two-component response regulator